MVNLTLLRATSSKSSGVACSVGDVCEYWFLMQHVVGVLGMLCILGGIMYTALCFSGLIPLTGLYLGSAFIAMGCFLVRRALRAR